MRVIVVRDEKNARALAGRLLKARTSQAATTRAIAAIRDANPGLDLDKLRPGDVVLVPELAGARKAVGDVLAPELDALAEQVHAGLGALERATASAREALQEEIRRSVQVIGEVSEFATADPRLAANIKSVKRTLDEDGTADEEQAVALNNALETWSKDLTRLRRLGP